MQRPFQSIFWDSGAGGLDVARPPHAGTVDCGGHFLWASLGLCWSLLLICVPPCIPSTCRVPVC